jgi:peptidoglycan/xylan/chitin deacetylase (PgdA/CDA1 family)
MQKGKFVISLDFEIYWGVHDAVTLSDYKENLLGVRKVIPKLLELFSQYQIHATFATVGFLFFNNKKDLLNNLPASKPQYLNKKVSPYAEKINAAGENETEDPLRFGLSLVNQIKDAGQEIASHTFSHFYCMEPGQTLQDFKEDLVAAKSIAAKNGIELKSIVFPRNQYNNDYLNICKEEGFTSFRGNEKSKLFSSETYGKGMYFRRPFRLADSYFNLSGHNCYSDDEMKENILINIPSSRFLRPHSKRLFFLEKYKLKRITNSMTYAAKNGLTFHLWWHPHNFGINILENFSFLEKILIHYQHLKEKYDFESMNMSSLANKLKKENF